MHRIRWSVLLWGVLVGSLAWMAFYAVLDWIGYIDLGKFVW